MLKLQPLRLPIGVRVAEPMTAFPHMQLDFAHAAKVSHPPSLSNGHFRFVEGFSMRTTARFFGEALTLVRVDKPPKEEAVGYWVGPMGKARAFCCSCSAFADPVDVTEVG